MIHTRNRLCMWEKYPNPSAKISQDVDKLLTNEDFFSLCPMQILANLLFPGKRIVQNNPP